VTMTQAELDALVAAKFEAEAKGLKNKNSELLNELKQAKEKADKFGNVTDEEIVSMLAMRERLAKDEFARAIAEGKTEDVINRVTSKVKEDYEAQLAAERAEREALQQKYRDAEIAREKLTVATEIAKASGTVKPQYQGLIHNLIADQVKIIDGKPRVVDPVTGDPILTKGGQMMTVAELVESKRVTYGDLFQPSAGGGAEGGEKKTTSGKGKLTLEEAGQLSLADYAKARAEGRI
jgi:hypothetical protein